MSRRRGKGRGRGRGKKGRGAEDGGGGWRMEVKMDIIRIILSRCAVAAKCLDVPIVLKFSLCV